MKQPTKSSLLSTLSMNLYYRWSKDFLEAGRKRLAGDTARAAAPDGRGCGRAFDVAPHN